MDEFRNERDLAQGSLFGPGTQLREARVRAGMTLEQVSAATRVSQRHLEMIEAGDFAHLPARTYAVGFSRSYARLVGLDEAEIAAEVRAALDAIEPDHYRRSASAFEPGDPARIPSSRLGWLTALAAVLLLLGSYSFYRSFYAPGGELPSLVEPAAHKAAAPRAAAPAIDPRGAVVFTALEDGVWVKFYDGQGQQLMQKQMAKGESYTVPVEAEGPQLWTGRPDALAITVGGRAVPRLADSERVMKDVLVTAAALLAPRGDTSGAGTKPATPAASQPAARTRAVRRSFGQAPTANSLAEPVQAYPPSADPAPAASDPASATSPTG